MIALIELLLRDPMKGMVVILFLLFFYLWREQGKIKVEMQGIEKSLDKKKLDKEDFVLYNNEHSKEHKGILEYLKVAVDLLKGGK